MWEKKTKTKFKTLLISNQLRYILDSYNELEEALEDWWKIYNSWVNTTATPQHNGYIQDNVYNITWFILSKEVEEEVKEEKETEEWDEDRRIDWYYYR